MEAREERQREIEQMVEDQPEEMAALLRGWLGAGRPLTPPMTRSDPCQALRRYRFDAHRR